MYCIINVALFTSEPRQQWKSLHQNKNKTTDNKYPVLDGEQWRGFNLNVRINNYISWELTSLKQIKEVSTLV